MFEPKIVNILLSICFNIGFVCSFEYSKHMFWLRNKKKDFNYTTLYRLESCLEDNFVRVMGSAMAQW